MTTNPRQNPAHRLPERELSPGARLSAVWRAHAGRLAVQGASNAQRAVLPPWWPQHRPTHAGGAAAPCEGPHGAWCLRRRDAGAAPADAAVGRRAAPPAGAGEVAGSRDRSGRSAAQSSANIRDDLQPFANRRQSRIGAEIRMAFDGRIGVVSQQRRAPYSRAARRTDEPWGCAQWADAQVRCRLRRRREDC